MASSQHTTTTRLKSSAGTRPRVLFWAALVGGCGREQPDSPYKVCKALIGPLLIVRDPAWPRAPRWDSKAILMVVFTVRLAEASKKACQE
jgi:hypothetical protein